MEVGTISSWVKKEGDKLEEGDIFCQIETDKAVMAMEAPYSGYLAKILFPENTKNIKINTPIAIIVKSKDDIGAFKDYSSPSASLGGTPSAVSTDKAKSKSTQPQPTPVPPVVTDSHNQDRVIASPLAKKVAREESVDIKSVKGTGPGGRVLASDVRDFVSSALTSPPPQGRVTASVSAPSSYADIDISMMRATIAKRLVLSKQNIPHFHITSEIIMDNCNELRQKINSQFAGKMKLSVNDFVIKACSLALLDVPECNSSWMETHIRRYHSTDISVAVSTSSGLITPVLFSAESKSLRTISSEMSFLAEKARNNKLRPNEYQGGTFSVSNLGMHGITSFNAIINPPQVCVLAVGSMQKKLCMSESDKSLFTQSVMNVSLGCDHRVVDGAVGAQWMKKFKEYLENPYLLIA